MVPPGIADMAPWRDFAAAARGALQFLHAQLGWDVWAVTRVEEDRQVVVHAQPTDAVTPGTWLPWADSFCRQMTAGEAPRAATVTAAVPAYASRMRGPIAGVAAYIGVPLVAPDGRLFGTLCGVAFRARPRSAARDLRTVEFVGRMLGTLMAAGMAPPDPPHRQPAQGG